jgi:hypothetical protein
MWTAAGVERIYRPAQPFVDARRQARGLFALRTSADEARCKLVTMAGGEQIGWTQHRGQHG